MFNNNRIGGQPAPLPVPAPAPAAVQQPQGQVAGPPAAGEMPADRLIAAVSQPSKAAPMLKLGLDAATAPADWGDVSIADRKANLKQLQSLARQLKAEGRPGVEIWSRLTRAAVDSYAAKSLPAARKSDFVMQDLVVAVIGSEGPRHLKTYQSLPWVRHPDPLAQTFFDDWAALGIPPANGDWKSVGWAGEELDRHHCADFRPEIADGSDNQIFHTLFYQFMAYTTQAPFTIHGGSIVHEFKDEGTSSEDHNACLAAVTTGMALRRQRDSQDAAAWLQDWPSITQAAYGKDGGPEIKAGTAGPRARAADKAIRELLAHKPLLWKAENAVIDGVKYAKVAGEFISRIWK
ncbi:MAG TPA: hypothetical protein V6D23_19085, partial [Candidatus Obscuribacterales bacterium]